LAKRGPDLIDPRLLKALGHPLRMEILGVLYDGPSSPTKIHRQLEHVSLNLVSYHMKILKELGCVELVETVTRKGATERIYRVVGWLIVSDAVWERLSPAMRQPLTVATLRGISEDLARSLGTGAFDRIPDNHLSRIPLRVDRKGWSEAVEILARTMDEIIEVGNRSVERMKSDEEAAIPATVALMQFPIPSAESDDSSEKNHG